MNFFATTYPKNMINVSFDNQPVVDFKKMFYKEFWKCTHRDFNCWNWRIQSNQKSRNTELLQNSVEFLCDFNLGTQSSVMIKFSVTTYLKNMISISFDNQSAVAFNKMFVKLFRDVLIDV